MCIAALPTALPISLLLLLGAAGVIPASAAEPSTDDAVTLDRAALREALAPHAWMARQPAWPCRYGARVEQRRTLGERTLSSDGRLYQDCRQGLVWQVDRPVPGAQVYARNGNYLQLDRHAEPRRLDGLAERRIGRLLQDLFIGDISALQRDFSHRSLDDASPAPVRLVPRDARLAARLHGIVISGDAEQTMISVQTAGASAEESLGLRLFAFASLDAPSDGGASTEACTAWLGSESEPDRVRAEAACDALARPGRWLERARRGSR